MSIFQRLSDSLFSDFHGSSVISQWILYNECSPVRADCLSEPVVHQCIDHRQATAARKRTASPGQRRRPSPRRRWYLQNIHSHHFINHGVISLCRCDSGDLEALTALSDVKPLFPHTCTVPSNLAFLALLNRFRPERGSVPSARDWLTHVSQPVVTSYSTIKRTDLEIGKYRQYMPKCSMISALICLWIYHCMNRTCIYLYLT